MKADNENRNVSITLNQDEALVLLEWLHNFHEKKWPTLFQHQSEEWILFDLEAALEKVIAGTFADDYENLLSKAREKIRDKE